MLWGGSPAVTSLSNGIDLPKLEKMSSNSEEILEKEHSSFEPPESALVVNVMGESSDNNKDLQKETVDEKATKRRENVNEMLKNRKDKKMAAKISNKSQMLKLAQEDVSFKKKILETMEKSDQEFKAGLTNLNEVMTDIGTAIKQSVGILGQMLLNQNRSTFPLLSPPFSPLRESY